MGRSTVEIKKARCTIIINVYALLNKECLKTFFFFLFNFRLSSFFFVLRLQMSLCNQGET
jgi:hypothetical protein